MPLLPLLGGIAAALPAISGIVSGVKAIFGGGAAPITPAPATLAMTPAAVFSAPGFQPSQLMLGPGATTAIQIFGRKVPHWLLDILRAYGPQVATAVWQEFQKRRRMGQSSAEARSALIAANPLPFHKHRRRMNPTNVRAARRAIRRLRGFKRVTRKVNRLLSPRVRVVRSGARRRSRGDILPFEHDGSINEYAAEDWADYADELEDLGHDPQRFFPEEIEE